LKTRRGVDLGLMRRTLAILILLGGLVLTAPRTASPDAGIPAANGGASASPEPTGTADAVAHARTRRGQATVLPTRS
jgi:hypothetical protein